MFNGTLRLGLLTGSIRFYAGGVPFFISGQRCIQIVLLPNVGSAKTEIAEDRTCSIGVQPAPTGIVGLLVAGRESGESTGFGHALREWHCHLSERVMQRLAENYIIVTLKRHLSCCARVPRLYASGPGSPAYSQATALNALPMSTETSGKLNDFRFIPGHCFTATAKHSQRSHECDTG